ncbi:MAG TPA: COX15/CtaA family protein [Gemmatimonadales bacterium]|jgi:heme A synthase|nr:COX15/CtaA family protein [Gemmatimonadales bacterium]
MTRRFSRLAWSAAACTYLLIILGAIVRITGSGMGCGEHWPLCNGRLLPPLDVPTMIEYAHRLVAAAVSALVVVLAAYTWWVRRGSGTGEQQPPSRAPYAALGLLVVQVLLGAVTVKLRLPPWTVILHLGTAMLLLATLLVIAKRNEIPPSPGSRAGSVALALGFVTVVLGALTANLGAASACLGFPLCNGQLVPAGNYVQYVQWTHRLLAYTLSGYVVWWAVHSKRRGAWYVVALVVVQAMIAGAMVLSALPEALRAAHVAVGAAIWAALVLVVL